MANYTVLYSTRDSGYVSTLIGSDGVERIISEETAYTATHGMDAPIGSEWQFAVIGEDEYNGLIAQVWVDSIDGHGDEFNPENYLSVQTGRKPFSSLMS